MSKRKLRVATDYIDGLPQRVELWGEIIENLCADEGSDIQYGFELGKLHTMIREEYIELLSVRTDLIEIAEDSSITWSEGTNASRPE